LFDAKVQQLTNNLNVNTLFSNREIPIILSGHISTRFSELGIKTFKQCREKQIKLVHLQHIII